MIQMNLTKPGAFNRRADEWLKTNGVTSHCILKGELVTSASLASWKMFEYQKAHVESKLDHMFQIAYIKLTRKRVTLSLTALKTPNESVLI